MAHHIRFHAIGGPEMLQIDQVETPEPLAGEVRIRVKAIGLNRAELMYRAGDYIGAPVFPAKLGYEAAGVIDAVGPGVVSLQVGDKVSVIPAFSFAEYGLYGDLVIAPARATVKHPETLSWAEAAATWMQYGAAWGPLIEIAKLGQGDVVLLPAAASSVGLAAIQLARAVGAIPVALTRSPAKVEALQEAGAAHVIVTGKTDLVAAVQKLTGGKGARVVFDPVGGPDFEKLVDATAIGGIILVYGALSPEITPLPMLKVLSRQLTISGFGLSGAMHDDTKLAALKSFVIAGIESGALRPKIARTFPFEQIVEAHRYMETSEQVGKVVVTI